MKIYSFIADKARKYSLKYRTNKARRWALNIEAKNMNHLELQDLTKDEEREILKVWGEIGLKPYPLFYKMFKTIDVFNPNYLSDDLYFPVILRTLNPDCFSKSFAHKGNFALLFSGISQPKMLACSIRGVFFNNKWEIVDKQVLLSILGAIDSFIIKPTKDSSCGQGVRLVKKNLEKNLDNIINGYGDDWIAQEVVCQSPITAQFNKSSVNSYRVTTLFINGVVTTQSICFKVGANQSVTDNLGSGGIMVGVTPEGYFYEYGYDNKYNKYKSTSNGILFKGVHHNYIPLISLKMEEYHTKFFPTVGIIGWDVAIDKDSNPIVLEANLNFPGIQFEQLAIGTPIFGKRTNEVIKYIKDNM